MQYWSNRVCTEFQWNSALCDYLLWAELLFGVVSCEKCIGGGGPALATGARNNSNGDGNGDDNGDGNGG